MIQKSDGGWHVDLQPAGRGGKRFRKTFKTKAEALAWEAWLKTQINQNEKWQPEKRDTRKLSELVDIWFKNHGIGLRAGHETHRSLLSLCKALNDPVADRFSVDVFTTYRTKRLAEGTSTNTLNHEHAYLRSVFNELIRMGLWKKSNPLKLLRPFKLQVRGTQFTGGASMSIMQPIGSKLN